MRVISLLMVAVTAYSATIAERMREQIDKHEITGAVTLVVNKQRVTRVDAVGHADSMGKVAMRPDSIFWIASMTKPITAAAILMLQESGKLSIDDPAAKYIPEFANLKTKDGKPVTITLRHMLTHTSGLAEATSQESKAARTLAELVPAFLQADRLRAWIEVAVLPVWHQLTWSHRGVRLGRGIRSLPRKAHLRTVEDEGYDVLLD